MIKRPEIVTGIATPLPGLLPCNQPRTGRGSRAVLPGLAPHRLIAPNGPTYLFGEVRKGGLDFASLKDGSATRDLKGHGPGHNLGRV